MKTLQFLRIKIPQGSGFKGRPELQFQSLLSTFYKALPEVELSFEMLTIAQYTSFVVALQQEHAVLVESMIYAQFQEAEIEFVPDYLRGKNFQELPSATLELKLKKVTFIQ